MPWGSLKRVSGSRVRFISSSVLPSPAGSQLCRCGARMPGRCCQTARAGTCPWPTLPVRWGDLPTLEVGEIGGRLEGVIQIAELVHQPQCLGILPGPDPAFGGFFRLFRAKAAALAHQADKALIGVFHAQLNGFTHVIRQGTGQPDPTKSVVPTPSVCTPYWESALSMVANMPNTPMEPVRVVGRRRSCPHRRRSSSHRRRRSCPWR